MTFFLGVDELKVLRVVVLRIVIDVVDVLLTLLELSVMEPFGHHTVLRRPAPPCPILTAHGVDAAIAVKLLSVLLGRAVELPAVEGHHAVAGLKVLCVLICSITEHALVVRRAHKR